jgi:hypothetical protein
MVVVGISMLLLAKSSEACSCIDVPRTDEQRDADFRAEYGRAIAVFVGRVILDDGYEATFEVQQVWKGDLSERVTLQTGERRANPDRVTISSADYHFGAGKTYLVFAYGTVSRMKSQCCSPTSDATLAAAASVLARLTSIVTPKPPNARMEPARRCQTTARGSFATLGGHRESGHPHPCWTLLENPEGQVGEGRYNPVFRLDAQRYRLLGLTSTRCH